jgi:uncharacterized small protein (DUF1192 family)
MDDLTESLNAAMAALDSYGFTRAAETLERASTEIDRLRARLEVRDDGGPDGITCRDETIKLQDEVIARLRAENERLKADAADAARYRWIKRGASFREERDMGPGGCWSIFVAVPRRPAVNSLDTAIDAAMAQGKV